MRCICFLFSSTLSLSLFLTAHNFLSLSLFLTLTHAIAPSLSRSLSCSADEARLITCCAREDIVQAHRFPSKDWWCAHRAGKQVERLSLSLLSMRVFHFIPHSRSLNFWLSAQYIAKIKKPKGASHNNNSKKNNSNAKVGCKNKGLSSQWCDIFKI